MKRVLTVLSVVFAFAAPAAAQDKSYAEVRYLYEKAFDAIEDVEPERRDYRYVSLSWDFFDFGDLELLARIPPKMHNEIYRAVVTAVLALAHARAGDCPAALEVNERAFTQNLIENLSSEEPQVGATAALKTVVQTYALCSAVQRAEEAIAAYKPDVRKTQPYLADAYSTIAASLYLADDEIGAERYLAKAMAQVEAIEEEPYRWLALSKIAYNQVAAGRYDDAEATIESTGLHPSRLFSLPIELIGPGSMNFVLLAHELALRGRWTIIHTAFESPSDERRYYSNALADAQIARVTSLDRERSLEELAKLQIVMRREKANLALVWLARAFAELGEEVRAIAILEDIYDRRIRDYRNATTNYVPQLMGEVLKSYVLMGRPNIALDKATSADLSQLNARWLSATWGALIGYARLHGDETLLRQVEPVLRDEKAAKFVRREIFAYYLEQRAFAEALGTIESQAAGQRPGYYQRLAREQMGILDWHHSLKYYWRRF